MSNNDHSSELDRKCIGMMCVRVQFVGLPEIVIDSIFSRKSDSRVSVVRPLVS